MRRCGCLMPVHLALPHHDAKKQTPTLFCECLLSFCSELYKSSVSLVYVREFLLNDPHPQHALDVFQVFAGIFECCGIGLTWLRPY